jgi:hypothetical protein
MTTLNKEKLHKPNVQAISTLDDDQFTFCENCEHNIQRFFYYDEDCGMRDTKWFAPDSGQAFDWICLGGNK